MASYDLTSYGAVATDAGKKNCVAQSRIDFSENNRSASDTNTIFSLPAGSIVTALHLRTITAEGGTCTVDVADGTTTYLSGANINTTGLSSSTATPVIVDGNITLTNNNNTSHAVIEVSVEFIKPSV